MRKTIYHIYMYNVYDCNSLSKLHSMYMCMPICRFVRIIIMSGSPPTFQRSNRCKNGFAHILRLVKQFQKRFSAC